MTGQRPMDPLDQAIIAMPGLWTEEDVAQQLEHMVCITNYLRAFGAGIQISVPTSEPAAILIAAAQVLESCQALTNLALLRSAAVREARRGMIVLNAKYETAARRKTIFTRAHWKLLHGLARAALLMVCKDESRRALVLVTKLADRKTNAPEGQGGETPLRVDGRRPITSSPERATEKARPSIHPQTLAL